MAIKYAKILLFFLLNIFLYFKFFLQNLDLAFIIVNKMKTKMTLQ